MSFVRNSYGIHPSDKSKQVEIDTVINQAVNDTTGYNDGVLEQTNSRIDKLIEIVGELAKLLPRKMQNDLVQSISLNDWVQSP